MGLRGVLLAAGAAIALAAPARADEAPKAKVEPQKRRTVLHFGEDDIRGDLTRPDGELVQAPRRPAESSLLRVRRSFVDRALGAQVRGR
jgi:hypothetical protein